jgi:hypothetical protein
VTGGDFVSQLKERGPAFLLGQRSRRPDVTRLDHIEWQRRERLALALDTTRRSHGAMQRIDVAVRRAGDRDHQLAVVGTDLFFQELSERKGSSRTARLSGPT